MYSRDTGRGNSREGGGDGPTASVTSSGTIDRMKSACSAPRRARVSAAVSIGPWAPRRAPCLEMQLAVGGVAPKGHVRDVQGSARRGCVEVGGVVVEARRREGVERVVVVPGEERRARR